MPPGSRRSTSRRSTSATRSGSCTRARATWARCRPPWSRSCGALRRSATRAPARRGRSRPSPRWPSSRRAATTSRWCSGVEVEKTLPGPDAARVQEAAAWVGHETGDELPIWPATFDRIAAEYERRHGLDEVHLPGHRRAEPAKRTGQPDGADPLVVADPGAASLPTTRRTRWSPAASGATTAARSPTAPPAWCSSRTGGSPSMPVSDAGARIAGWGHRTVGLVARVEADGSPRPASTTPGHAPRAEHDHRRVRPGRDRRRGRPRRRSRPTTA